MQQLSTQNVSAMEVVKNTLRNRGVFGLYKVRDTRPNSAHQASLTPMRAENGALPGTPSPTAHQGLDSMVYFATPKAAIRFSGFEAASNAMRSADGSSP